LKKGTGPSPLGISDLSSKSATFLSQYQHNSF
jgi:hypothetical protein